VAVRRTGSIGCVPDSRNGDAAGRRRPHLPRDASAHSRPSAGDGCATRLRERPYGAQGFVSVIALHAMWSRDSRLCLWGQDSALSPCPPALRGRPPVKPRPRAHPFACGTDVLGGVLRRVCPISEPGALVERDLCLLLPSVARPPTCRGSRRRFGAISGRGSEAGVGASRARAGAPDARTTGKIIGWLCGSRSRSIRAIPGGCGCWQSRCLRCCARRSDRPSLEGLPTRACTGYRASAYPIVSAEAHVASSMICR
jgi:hypothetical protein